MIAVLLAWVALGDLALLGLAAAFPRHVFVVGPESAWPALACLAGVWVFSGRESFAKRRDELATLGRTKPWSGVAFGASAAIVAMNAAAVGWYPAGVDAEYVYPDGTRTQISRTADFDLDRSRFLDLLSHPGAAVHMKGCLVPEWNVPWAGDDAPNAVTRWLVTARGAFTLWLNPSNSIVFDNRALVESGALRIANLGPRGEMLDLRFEPAGNGGDGRLTVELERASLRWHLFANRISLAAFWFVSMARVLLAALIVLGLPPALSLGVSALRARVTRWPSILAGVPLREVLAVCVAAFVYVQILSPRITPSASGDQAAFLNWVQYWRHGQLAQSPPDWARWNGNEVGGYASLASHFRLPPPLGNDPDSARGDLLVDDKPFGLPLLLLIAQAIGGEEASYFVPAWMAALAVAALYGAARVSGLGVLTAVAGAALLAVGREFVHGATVLDPDTPATACLAVFFFALLLLRRGPSWAVLAGASIGMGCLTRYNLGLAFILAVPFLWPQRRRIAPFIAGGVPFLVIMLVLNRLAYGGIFVFPYRFYVGHLAFELPYWSSLRNYVSIFAADAPPVFWLGFLAFPFLERRPLLQRASVFLLVVVWFAFFGAFGGWDAHRLRYLLPMYPLIIWGGLHAWSHWAGTQRARRLVVLSVMAAGAALWIASHGIDDDPETGDTSRVAAIWVDRIVPPGALLATDGLFNNAIYYYSGLRRFPATLDVERPDYADLEALQHAAHETGHPGDWFFLVHDFWVGRYRSAYPEMRLEEAASGPEWTLFRVSAILPRDPPPAMP